MLLYARVLLKLLFVTLDLCNTVSKYNIYVTYNWILI